MSAPSPAKKFEAQKNAVLRRIDKSGKGSFDTPILPILTFLNQLPQFATTSSCSGRITLLAKATDKKQKEVFIFSSHAPVAFDEIPMALQKISAADVWFKQQGAILHVLCETITAAQDLVDCACAGGFKHSGILSTRKKIMVEVLSSETIETIIAKHGVLLASEDFLQTLIGEANAKMEKNQQRLDKFLRALKSHFLFSC